MPELVNFGCPGETTGSFVTDPCPWSAARSARAAYVDPMPTFDAGYAVLAELAEAALT